MPLPLHAFSLTLPPCVPPEHVAGTAAFAIALMLGGASHRDPAPSATLMRPNSSKRGGKAPAGPLRHPLSGAYRGPWEQGIARRRRFGPKQAKTEVQRHRLDFCVGLEASLALEASGWQLCSKRDLVVRFPLKCLAVSVKCDKLYVQTGTSALCK